MIAAKDLRQGQVVQDGYTVLQVGAVRRMTITAQVLYPVPKRTVVRSYWVDANGQVPGIKPCTDYMYAKCEAAYGKKEVT